MPDTTAAQAAWQAAKDEFPDCVDFKDTSILTCSSITDALTAVYAVEKEHARIHNASVMNKLLSTPVQIIMRLAPALDVFCQMEPMILCPIWGSLRLMCMVRAK